MPTSILNHKTLDMKLFIFLLLAFTSSSQECIKEHCCLLSYDNSSVLYSWEQTEGPDRFTYVMGLLDMRIAEQEAILSKYNPIRNKCGGIIASDTLVVRIFGRQYLEYADCGSDIGAFVSSYAKNLDTGELVMENESEWYYHDLPSGNYEFEIIYEKYESTFFDLFQRTVEEVIIGRYYVKNPRLDSKLKSIKSQVINTL